MVLFLLGHVSGNFLIFGSPNAINDYAKSLREIWPLLWVARIGLIFFVSLHIYLTIKLALLNKKASPHKKRPTSSTTTSRYMVLSGLIVLSFICYHIAHLTLRWTHPEFNNLGEFDVRQMLILSFSSPWTTSFYLLSMVFIGAHLSHGVTSVFQTLGFGGRKYKLIYSSIGPIFGLITVLGFSVVPLSIFLGWLN